MCSEGVKVLHKAAFRSSSEVARNASSITSGWRPLSGSITAAIFPVSRPYPGCLSRAFGRTFSTAVFAELGDTTLPQLGLPPSGRLSRCSTARLVLNDTGPRTPPSIPNCRLPLTSKDTPTAWRTRFDRQHNSLAFPFPRGGCRPCSAFYGRLPHPPVEAVGFAAINERPCLRQSGVGFCAMRCTPLDFNENRAGCSAPTPNSVLHTAGSTERRTLLSGRRTLTPHLGQSYETIPLHAPRWIVFPMV